MRKKSFLKLRLGEKRKGKKEHDYCDHGSAETYRPHQSY
jgi:hypothetical protein